jgi:hypothetical protein
MKFLQLHLELLLNFFGFFDIGILAKAVSVPYCVMYIIGVATVAAEGKIAATSEAAATAIKESSSAAEATAATTEATSIGAHRQSPCQSSLCYPWYSIYHC